jgi:hypothetical protein
LRRAGGAWLEGENAYAAAVVTALSLRKISKNWIFLKTINFFLQKAHSNVISLFCPLSHSDED